MGALQVNYRIYADVRNENTGIIIAKQNDTKTRYLDITITDNGVPIDLTGCEVRIYGRKYDNTEIYNDGILQDAATGRCLIEATTQLLAYPGQNVRCEIVVFKDNVQILSTMPFNIFVVKSLMGENAIESSNEYGALVVLFQNLYEAYDLMTTMVQNIGTPDAVAAQYNLATMWQAWEFLVAYMKGDLTNKIDEAIANAAVQGVLDRIGITTDTGGSDTAGTVMGKLNSTLNGGVKVVKSVQRGTYVVNDSGNHSISISSIDPDKSIAIIDAPSGATGSSGSGNTYCIFAGLNTDELIVYSHNHTNYTIGWQIIEFY